MRRLRALVDRNATYGEGGFKPPSLVVVAAAVAAVAVGCSDSKGSAERAPAASQSGTLSVTQKGQTDAAWVVGDRLRLADGRSKKLRRGVNATLIATLAPAAVPDAAGDSVAYNSWRGTRPTVRIHDIASKRDSLLDDGAHSPAWAGNGALAYFKALNPDLRDPKRYLGHVVVRQSQNADARRWTRRPGRYVVAAWARGNVLFYGLGESFPDLFILERPGRQRLLARASALVAVSPDGRRAFVSRYGASPPLVRLIDVPSGREVARLTLDAATVRYVIESGSWSGDLVLAATTTGVAVFRVSDEAIELAQMLSAGSGFPVGLSEPRGNADGRRFVAWGELEPRPRQAIASAALVECDRLTLRCVRAAVGSTAAPPRPLYNPSRP